MFLPTLYSRTNTGAIQEWTVEIDGDSYRTIHGQVDGKLQTTEWTVCIVTNEGRANQRLPDAQAIFEARAMWTKKVDSGYHENVDDIDNFTFTEPMLAKKYEDRKGKIVYPVFSQPKLDGLRAVISRKGAFTRQGKRWVSIPHILKALEPLFAELPDLVIDGELYNHEFHDDFNKITSLVKKTKLKEEDLYWSEKYVQFWWYDVCDPTRNVFGRQRFIRFNHFKHFSNENSPIVLVPTTEVSNEEQLTTIYGGYLEDGYEGQMVRINEPYEYKRSNTLLKRKEFQDAEYIIEDVVEGTGNRSGMAGSMVFTNELGHTFNSNIKGTREYLKELWEDRGDSVIGKKATIRFFNLTPDKLIPRFPYVYGISPDKN